MTRWEIDRRRCSPYTRAYLLGMRLRRDKHAFEDPGHTLRLARQLQERGDAPPTWFTRLVARVGHAHRAGMTVWTVRPRRRAAEVKVLYVHGGGYVHPLTADYWRLARALVGAPAEVTVPWYPLAPTFDVDHVLPRLLSVYDDLEAASPALPVVLMGDSAGGALVLAMAFALRDRDKRQPVAVVALSPWLDATLAAPAVEDLEATDPMLAESGLRAAGRWWAGAHDPEEPVVSPVHGDLSGLPPLHVYIGDRDILRPAVDRLADQATQDAADLSVHEVTSMFHVWMTRAIPEGRRTRVELARLVARAGRAGG